MGDRGLAVFDLDGTLHRTEMALLPAIRLALRDVGAPQPSEREILALFGEPMEVFCGTMLADPDSWGPFRDGVRRHQAVTVPESGESFPGTGEMLRRLREKGWTLAVCSNSGLGYIELVTGALGLGHLFDHLRGTRGEASKTVRVGGLLATGEYEAAFMAGDRYHDVEAGVENGIASIGCAYGYGAPEELEQADFVVGSPLEILDVAAGLPRG